MIQRGSGMGLPGADRLLALKERQPLLPPAWQHILQARIRQARVDIAMRKRRLNDTVKRLDEYDQLLASFEQGDNAGFEQDVNAGGDAGDEPLSPFRAEYRAENRGQERSQARLRGALRGIFEDLLVKDADEDWGRTDEGLRVPAAKAVNTALTELGFEPLREEEVKQAYISCLNGDS